MSAAVIMALHLVVLHGPDGQLIEINPEEVISLRSPHIEGHVHHAINCLIYTSDGKYLGVVEECADVQTKLTGVDE
jgi:hypothetical protein